ncbi:MAG: type II toxin-antitoxin system RelE/ParE family toxin [Wenzhouxiangella sp.]
MAKYRFTQRAELDLEAIADYTIERFGVEKARSYLVDFKSCFDCLVENPGIGRRVEHLRPELRRYEHGSHIVFYQVSDGGILIVRVLHYRMDVKRHL